jgi:protein-disulfide isomerase
MSSSSDPRKFIVIGMVAIAVLMLGGMVWAVASASKESDGGRYDPNASFIDDGDPTYGPDSAKVIVRIFEDFQCSACRFAQLGIRHMKEVYGDRVHLVWNDFPLEAGHPNARLASNAARCAEEQGMFWEYAEALYDAQAQWVEERDPSGLFISYAERFGMREPAFTSCLDERRYDEKIRNDVNEALANRVDATPTFFVNNKRYAGALSQDQWDAILKPLLGEESVPAEKDELDLLEGAAPIELQAN